MRKITLLLLIVVATHAGAQIINVPADYPTIQQGIDAAQPGDTVMVADGTYYEQITINKLPLLVASNFYFDGDSTHLYNTIIDGDSLISPNQTVVMFNAVDSTAILAGFTIQNGKGTKIGQILSAGGIKLYYSGAKIIHNRIIDNILDGTITNSNVIGAGIAGLDPSADWVVLSDNLIKGNVCISSFEKSWGAGAYIRSKTRFSNNIVSENICKGFSTCYTEGAGLCIDGFSTYNINLVCNYNKFYNNRTENESNYSGCAGLWTGRSKNIIANNEFIGNETNTIYNVGGALSVYKFQASIVRDNLFKENKAYHGSALYADVITDDTLLIENNIFLSNEAYSGAAAVYIKNGTMLIQNNVFNDNHALNGVGGALHLYKQGSHAYIAKVVNNSFSGNTATTQGGAIAAYNANPYLLNNIFWDNDAPTGQDICIISGEASMAYCNIDTTKLAGTVNILEGNILLDPLFCDTTCLMVSEYSPCLNSGVDYYVFAEMDTVFAPLYDILYTQRPLDWNYDMGAYELPAWNSGVNDMDAKFNLSIYPNPTNTILNCHYSLEKESKVALTLYDILGTLKYSREFRQPAGEHVMPLNMEGLTKGVYLLKLQVGDKFATRKVIKH